MGVLTHNMVRGALVSMGLMGCSPYYTTEKQGRAVQTLQGTYLSAKGGEIPLDDGQARPTLIQFASDTCMVCAQEVAAFKSYLKSKPAPSRVRLISVLVGAFAEDAIAWSQRLQVGWEVGIDPDLVLFKKYCREDSVPCMVVHRPAEGIVLSHQGAMSIDEILAYTGPWGDN